MMISGGSRTNVGDNMSEKLYYTEKILKKFSPCQKDLKVDIGLPMMTIYLTR